MRTYNEPKLNGIINGYKIWRVNNPDKHIEFVLSQDKLVKAIKVAAQAVDRNNRIHDHQQRVGRKNLNKFAKKLCTCKAQISKVNDFDALHGIVESKKFQGIGKLTIYDTAHRIGTRLKKLPDKIYLHGGTKTGARILLGSLPRQDYLFPNELPLPFQRTDLEPWEIEDILCIFKPKFGRCIIKAN
jgi:hypothetical protein